MSEEAKAYVQKCLALGFSEAQIRVALAKSGYPPQVIEDVLDHARAPKTPAPISPREVPAGTTPISPPSEEASYAKLSGVPSFQPVNYVAETHATSEHLFPKDIGMLPDGLGRRLWLMSTHPDLFFTMLEKEPSPYRALSQYLFASGTIGILWFLLIVGTGPTLLGAEYQTTLLVGLVVGITSIALYPVVLTFWHLFVKVSGASSNVNSTIKVGLYSMLPAISLSWVPGFNVGFFVYAWVLMIRGLKMLSTKNLFIRICLVLLLLAFVSLLAQQIRVEAVQLLEPLFLDATQSF